MAYTVSGTLKLPDGTAAAGVDLRFVALTTFSPLIESAEQTVRTGANGSYSIALEISSYNVFVTYNNNRPFLAGRIVINSNTAPGQDLPTLLGGTYQPATPDWIQQVEAWLAQAQGSAVAAEGFANTAKTEANRSKSEADRSKTEADRAAQIAGLATVTDAIRLAILPQPDVSIPFTTDGQLLHGKGTPVLVGTTPVAQMVSYERLGSQTMLDKSGRLVTVPAGEMAIEQQGLAIFDQSVNLAGPSINWAASANAAAPWAHSAKDEFGWISVSGSGDPSKTEGSYKDFSVPTVDTPHTLSLDILKAAGLNVKLRTYGAATGTTVDVTITETAASGSGGSDVYDMGHYWRVELSRTFSSSTRLFRIYPFGTVAGSTGSMSYRRVQLEAKPFATPYIENETSAQTARPATTRCDIPWRGNMLPISDNQQLTIAFEVDTAGDPQSGVSHTFLSQGSGVGQYVMIRAENGGFIRAYRGAVPTHQTAISPRRRYRMCYRINRNVCDLFIDGVKIGSAVTAKPNAAGINDMLRIGYLSTPDRCLNGHLRKIDIWNAPLTDIQCQSASV